MIGKIISHYKILEKLGEGGMGVVYKAEDTKLDRRVALKFLTPQAIGSEQEKARFVYEAKAAAALNHSNICTVHEIDEAEGQSFIAMEYVDGEDLRAEIESGPLKLDEAVSLAIQIAEGLRVAHKRKIVHRDIKPANIMVTSEDQVKIMDFGLAKSHGRTQLTKTGTTLGTVAYMSPEQARGGDVDQRSDIWSLGAVLYEMVTGKKPFKGDYEPAVVYSILNAVQEPMTALRTGVPMELERIVNKALEKDPALRYQSAADLCADLKRLRRDSLSDRVVATPPPVAAGSKRRWLLASGAVVAVLAVGVTAVVLWQSARREASPEATIPATGVETRAAQSSSSGPSIAVLPLTNAGGDPDQEYFSDGLTEDIITELSHYRELSVIAHSSTARYKGSDIDVPEIGTTLGTRYVLQGSVRKTGQRIRVRMQLSDSHDGHLVWGSNYERDLTARDLFELQDELTQQVVSAIAGSYGALTRAELPGARRKPPASLDSYDCVLRAYEYLQVHTPENHLAARDCLEGVIETDPDYVDGLAWLAYLYAEEYHHRWNERTDEYDALDRALELAEEAVQLDTANHVAHGALSLIHMFRGEYEHATIEGHRTIDLSPNNALWLAVVGMYLAQQEDFEHGMPMVRKAIALTPHPPSWIMMAIFYDHYHHGRYQDALVEAKGMDLGGDFRGSLFLAAAYGQLGRPDDAGQALDELRALWPRPVGDIRQELIERHAFTPELTDHLLEGLEKAGLEGVVDSLPALE
jgi:serine/threonine protein kinase/Tfp pilus assembly protein PilF